MRDANSIANPRSKEGKRLSSNIQIYQPPIIIYVRVGHEWKFPSGILSPVVP